MLVGVLAAELAVEMEDATDVCAAVDDNKELVPVERLLLVVGVLVCKLLVVATVVLVLDCRLVVDAVLVCKLVVLLVVGVIVRV